MARENQGTAPQRGYLQLGTHVRSELIIGFQIFMWGLLLIYICLRAGDIIPGSTDLPQYVPVNVVIRGDANRLASMWRINPPLIGCGGLVESIVSCVVVFTLPKRGG